MARKRVCHKRLQALLIGGYDVRDALHLGRCDIIDVKELAPSTREDTLARVAKGRLVNGHVFDVHALHFGILVSINLYEGLAGGEGGGYCLQYA